MITITGTFMVGGQQKAEHTGAPPITITAVPDTPARIRIVSDYDNVRDGGPAIMVQVAGLVPQLLTKNRGMNVGLPLDRTIWIYQR